MELYVHSSSDSSWGCVRRLLEEWTLAFPEYSTTANVLMKRVKLIKSHPKTAQASNSQATAEGEGSSLPNSPATRGLVAEESGPNITTSAVGSEGELTGTSKDPQGESEEVSMDSDLGLEELVRKVNQHYRRLLRDTNLRGRRSIKWPGVCVDGRQHAVINQWMQGVKPKTSWEVNCMVYAAASIHNSRSLLSLLHGYKGGKMRSAYGSCDS